MGLPVVPEVKSRASGASPPTATDSASGSASCSASHSGPVRMTSMPSMGVSFSAWSGSATTIRAPEPSMRIRAAPVAKAVNSGTWTAPRRHTASIVMTSSSRLDIMIGTVSPGPTPRAARPDATRRERSASSPWVRSTAVMSGAMNRKATDAGSWPSLRRSAAHASGRSNVASHSWTCAETAAGSGAAAGVPAESAGASADMGTLLRDA